MLPQGMPGASGGGGGAGGHGGPGGGMPPAAVSVMQVALAPLPASYEYVGQAAGSREVEVRARTSGILLKRNFREGTSVSRGQSLYTLDPEPLKAALDRADADVASAEARLGQATRTQARLKPLFEAKAVSQKDYDESVSAESIARADLKGAQARRAEAALNLGYTRVEAPIGGIIGRSQVSEGTLVAGPRDERSIVRLYERWLKTGSARLAEELGVHGIIPGRGAGGLN